MAGFFYYLCLMKLFGKIWILVMLASLAACNSRESQKMEAALEQAVAVYGDGNLEIEVDTALFIPGLSEASAYFASKKQYEKAALAALLNGYSEKDFDKEVAMQSFKEAEHYGELAQDSLTMARAEYWMGKMLYNDCSYQFALDYLRNAAALLEQHYDEKILTMNLTACCFMLLNELDSATLYLDQCVHYLDLADSNTIKIKVLNNYAVLYRLKGDYTKAIDCLRQIKPLNEAQKFYKYLNIAELFYKIGTYDSAGFYFNELEPMINETSVKDKTICAAYEGLSNLAESQGQMKEAFLYRKEYERHLLNVLDRINQKNSYRIQQKYDYEALLNTMNRKIANKQQIIAFFWMLLAFWGIALAVTQHRLAVKIKQEAKAKERVLYYIQQYHETLEKQGEIMRKVAIVEDHKNDLAVLDDLIKTVFGKKDPWNAIIEVFDTLHPGERKIMEQRYPQLTKLEMKSLILSHLNVSRQDEALLLNINIHSLDKLRQSVKKKTTTEDGFTVNRS